MHIGVVGVGYWGSKHLRVLSSMPDVQNITIIERDIELQKSMLASFPMAQAVSDLETVLPELDGVVIATNPESHFKLGMQALESGVSALIEKPMATSLKEASTLCRTAKEAGVALMAGHTFEFNPAVGELKKCIQTGQLGDVHYLRSLRLNLGLYQNDVNVIWDLAPHDISILNFLLDDMPTTVSTWGQTTTAAQEDVAMIRLQFESSGIEAYVHVSWLDPSKIREVTVVGSEKMAVYDDVKTQERLRLFDCGVNSPAADTFNAPMSYRYGDITSPFINFQEPLGLENRHFVDAIKLGAATQSNGYSGARVVAVVEAAQRSLQRSQPVQVAEIVEELDGAVDLDLGNPAGAR